MCRGLLTKQNTTTDDRKKKLKNFEGGKKQEMFQIEKAVRRKNRQKRSANQNWKLEGTNIHTHTHTHTHKERWEKWVIEQKEEKTEKEQEEGWG